jgi:hypothetical protein
MTPKLDSNIDTCIWYDPGRSCTAPSTRFLQVPYGVRDEIQGYCDVHARLLSPDMSYPWVSADFVTILSVMSS